MDALKKKDFSYTVADIYALPEGGGGLLDGELCMMAPPGASHQRLVHFFDREIGNYIQRKQGDCEYRPTAAK